MTPEWSDHRRTIAVGQQRLFDLNRAGDVLGDNLYTAPASMAAAVPERPGWSALRKMSRDRCASTRTWGSPISSSPTRLISRRSSVRERLAAALPVRAFLVRLKHSVGSKRSRMVVRPARVVTNACSQAGRTISRPVSANPAGLLRKPARAEHLSARIKAIGSTVPRGMPFANRLCPDENLLRQNASI